MAPKKKTKPESAGPVWQVMGDDGKWTPFPEADSVTIEKQFRSGAAGFITSDLSFNKGFDSKYAFNFAKMTQTNMDSNKTRDISRIAPASEFEWEWKDDMGKFVGFYDDDCALLEKLWRENGLNKPAQTKALSFNKGFGSQYEFTFTTHDDKAGTVGGSQVNKDSGKVRDVRRSRKKQPWDAASYGMTAADATKKAEEVKAAAAVAAAPAPPSAAGATPTADKGSLDAPKTWQSPVPFAQAKLGEFTETDLDSTSLEFASVAGDFAASCPGCKVVGIRRVQNSMLWGFYALNRQQMVARNGGSLADATEKMLYIGVDSLPNLKTVCRLGFDVRMADANGIFGQGLYFARKVHDAGKTLAKPNGNREMIVARVSCGKYATGSKGIRRPPPLDPSKPTMALYDSCVDNVKSPSVHIVFSNNQAYPEYIVEYSPPS
uniref:Poly [ADP-ribose] polymerase n=1 Tax=Neobodo designis TaxID=312471 RepID=A0A7S1Q365_NEODS|mmetsp:Transcript_29790/g.91926  ORF Transcript_29790/g.91926 Transcript_29790/m.91926 type:complete len:433 (+) Transcript_29790:41-1339(+)